MDPTKPIGEQFLSDQKLEELYQFLGKKLELSNTLMCDLFICLTELKEARLEIARAKHFMSKL